MNAHANFYDFSLLECKCDKATEKNCDKVTGKCGDCKTGFFGDFCETGNYKLIMNKNFNLKIFFIFLRKNKSNFECTC